MPLEIVICIPDDALERARRKPDAIFTGGKVSFRMVEQIPEKKRPVLEEHCNPEQPGPAQKKVVRKCRAKAGKGENISEFIEAWAVWYMKKHGKTMTGLRVQHTTGLHQSTYCSLKNGRKNAGPTQIERVANAFGVTADEFMRGPE